MKTKALMAVAALALSVCMVSCGNNKKQQEGPQGEKMGEVFVVKKENGKFTLVTGDGYDYSEDYDSVSDAGGFLAGYSGEKIVLLSYKGLSFTTCASFEIRPLYSAGGDSVDVKYIAVSLKNGMKVAFDLSTRTSLCKCEGMKEGVYPLSNGYVIYQQEGKLGFAKNGAEEPILDTVCSEMVVVSVKDKVYLLIKSDDFTGYIDWEGNGVKQLSNSQFKVARKAGKVLWDEGKVKAVAVSKI